jgi:hypothetical protein
VDGIKECCAMSGSNHQEAIIGDVMLPYQEKRELILLHLDDVELLMIFLAI